MKENPYYNRNWILKRYLTGPLSAHLGPFSTYLSSLGYVYSTGQRYVREAGRLSLWMNLKKISLEELNEQTVEVYLRFREKDRCSRVNRSTYGHLFEHLRQNCLVKVIDVPESALEHHLRDYREHLIKNSGLTADTIRRHTRVARHFLTHWDAEGNFKFSQIRPQDITRWIVNRFREIPLSGATEVSSLRSFLRFQVFRGEISADVVESIPTVRHWKNSSLPTFLNSQEIRLLFEHCDRQTPIGQRDTAIISLLIGLGLRAIEVCRLRLEDIDWQAGLLTVSGKSGKGNRLPLLRDVGESIAIYLRYGRPYCSARHLFVSSKAPFRSLSSSRSVANVVRKALVRAGLSPQQKGPHLLRRSFATQMLERGATLSEIAQILRHESIDTTAIYAKVDLGRLRPLARTWPEGVRS